jgi:hypothetical protein
MTKPIETPWGTADYADTIAPGIVFYGTPSHGGIWLSAERVKEMPNYFAMATFTKSAMWYEEDLDVNMVIVAFPEYFTEKEVDLAGRCLAAMKPEEWAKFTAERKEAA